MSTETKDTVVDTKKRKEPSSEQESQPNSKKTRFYVDVLYYGVESGSDYGADRIQKLYDLEDAYKEAIAAAGSKVKLVTPELEGTAVVETEEFSTKEDRDKAHKLLQNLLSDRSKEHHPEPDCVFSNAAIYVRDV